MTEIQFILDLVMNHKLPVAVKEKLLARIGEVEQRFSVQPILAPTRVVTSTINSPAPIAIPPEQRMSSVMVDTGVGTKGPRKF
jgi:hypothetical protein